MKISSTATHTALICCLLGSASLCAHESEAQLPFKRPHAHSKVQGHAHLGLESHYFSEGRDALNGDSLFASSVEFGWKHIAAGIWYGYSPDQRYDELQLSLALTHNIGNCEFYLGYTHFQFPFEDTHDNEVGFGIAISELPLDLEFSADFYYSFDADGYFAEFALSREFSVTDQLTLSTSGTLGMNQGYVTDGHDGANHFALRVGLEYPLSDSFSLVAHSTYSWAIDKDSSAPGDNQLIDFFHAGVGLEWSF